MRKECKINDEALVFNEYLKELKSRFESGNNSDFYQLIRENKISLITKDESFKSDITKEQANEFLGLEIEPIQDNKDTKDNQKGDKAEDIFDELD